MNLIVCPNKSVEYDCKYKYECEFKFECKNINVGSIRVDPRENRKINLNIIMVVNELSLSVISSECDRKCDFEFEC